MLTSSTGPDCHQNDGWFDAWFAAFAPHAAREPGQPPMIEHMVRAGPLPLRARASATNVHSILYDWPAEIPLDAAGIAAHFADPRIAMLRFEYLDEGARLLAAARALSGHYALRIEPHAISPSVDCRAGFSTWFDARSKKLRYRLRTDRRSLIDGDGMHFTFDNGSAELDHRLNAMLAIERSGWKGRAGSAIADDPATDLFYRRLAHNAARAGALRIALLHRGEQLVAFEMGVVAARRLFLLKVGYDEAFAAHAPGNVLAAEHIRATCEDPAIDWYDKMGNGMTPAAYKLRFADTLAVRYRLTIYANGWRGRVARLHDSARAEAKRRLKRKP
ncbi:GNAT family N-acetyltransferase [Sphingomonas baiyangensis]|uniref:GNAT family N-acetyltransferase n=1 Tax=Sphingomonas baiyangensis TaxID=2572576 RepID=A0A4U1L4D0_9SPHN|nr:GNAT family N-acetyltransferase [Sphingomonas baiyangensis]TKD51025.1 GNAT family N-acetyltransferase [Sphingomonas baiyangensis]